MKYIPNLMKIMNLRGVFLDISKTFDKVWHQGIIHKLKCNGIGGNLLSLLADFCEYKELLITTKDNAKINASVL